MVYMGYIVIHFFWLLFIVLLFFIFLNMYMYIVVNEVTFMSLDFTFFLKMDFTHSFSFFFDSLSLIFSMVVCFITFNVIIFSNYYMHGYYKSLFFMFLMISFVMSMLFLINSSNIFMLMLGWDGLGIVSFFLILYYQSPGSIYSSLITVLMNRFGDTIMILIIVLMFFYYPLNYYMFMYSFLPFPFLFLFGLMTKSALFPFSSWLPAAMAAPTPISALVHSSTLVTAGLYLMMRFYYLFNLDLFCSYFMVCVGLFTSFYAGLNCLVETDLKKVVALSTLSHLGFICTALFSGSVSLSFLHLISHALFKSLLFISVGEMITTYSHNQDKRFMGNLGLLSKHSSYLYIFSMFNLLGLPFISGFYSKDMILESFLYSGSSYMLVIVLYFNLIFTFYYTFLIMTSLSFSSLQVSFMTHHPHSLYSSFFMLMMSLSSVYVVYFLLKTSYLVFIMTLPGLNKSVVYLLMLVFVLLYFSGLKFSLNSYLGYYFSNMMYLTSVVSNFSSVKFLGLSGGLYKCYESGLFYFIFNSSVVNIFFMVSSYLYKIFSYMNWKMVFILFFLLPLIL